MYLCMLTLLLYGSTTMTITQSLVGCLTQGIDTQGRYRSSALMVGGGSYFERCMHAAQMSFFVLEYAATVRLGRYIVGMLQSKPVPP